MYTSDCIDDKTYHTIINTLRQGYVDKDGITRKPNNQVADILVLEANLGCRIGDIVNLTTDSFVCDGGIWKINIQEQKTKKSRVFIVPKKTKAFIDDIAGKNYGDGTRLFGIGEAAVWKALRILTRSLGIKNCGSHGFRKKCANDLYSATGYDIEIVARFLNHASVNTTRRYIRRSDQRMEQAISEVVNLA